MTDRLRDSYDVVVVGGGAAGLSGALMLARSRRSVLVIDAGAPRNAPAAGVHGLLARDGMPPAELLDRGRAEVRGYGAQVVAGRGQHRRHDGDGFAVTLADGQVVRARRLLVATGLADELPDVPGLRGPVGQGRGALPVLPRLGGPRPGHRRAGQRSGSGAPGAAVPAADPRCRPVLAPHAATGRRGRTAAGRPWRPRGAGGGGVVGDHRRPPHRGAAQRWHGRGSSGARGRAPHGGARRGSWPTSAWNPRPTRAVWASTSPPMRQG